MQQAYRALRIVAEAQTIRIVLTTHPAELMLKELRTACATLDTESSSGVKAVVLDFVASLDDGSAGGTRAYLSPRQGATRLPTPMGTLTHKDGDSEDEAVSQAAIDGACAAVRAVAQPVLAVVRSTLSAAACALVCAADLTLVAYDAMLTVPDATSGNDMLTGAQAARLGYVTWTVPVQHVSKEMERILDLLRGKSAVALRHAKASVRLGQADYATRLEALNQVNTFYLERVMQTADAHEGLRAFLEKRQPEWKNS